MADVSDRDVWAAAYALVKRFGAEAAVFAAMRADEWMAQGDMDQYLLSKRIMTAVDELLAQSPAPGVKLM
ncbi:MAG: hypothetical protein PW843_28380 [Azospirillaceae bacterium]|nr:hypothetical protein [Azospirillaceae bacterium]